MLKGGKDDGSGSEGVEREVSTVQRNATVRTEKRRGVRRPMRPARRAAQKVDLRLKNDALEAHPELGV